MKKNKNISKTFNKDIKFSPVVEQSNKNRRFSVEKTYTWEEWLNHFTKNGNNTIQ